MKDFLKKFFKIGKKVIKDEVEEIRELKHKIEVLEHD